MTPTAGRQVSSSLCALVRRRGCGRAGVCDLFQQPLGVKLRMRPLEADRGLSPFSWGSNQGAVYKLWRLLLEVSAEGHSDTQRPRRVFSATHRNPQAHPRAQSQSHTPTHVNTQIQCLTHRPMYVPNFLQSCCETRNQFSVMDSVTWKAGSGLTAR